MKNKIHIFVICLVLVVNSLFAQSPMDCSTSTVSACAGNPSFPFSSMPSPTGYGAIMDLPGNSTSSISNPSSNPNPLSTNMGCLFSGEVNGTWVTVNISSPGTLEFNIAQIGFEDWAMWPLTPTTCSDIANDLLAPVACNWNASPSGGTGMGTVPPLGDPGNFEPAMLVTAGQSFIILVTNFSGVSGAVSMAFTGSAGTSCVPFSASSSKTICPGGTATLTASTNLASPSYTWMPGGASTSSISVSPASTTIYTVTISGTNTITSIFTSSITTSTVTVLPSPTISLLSNNMVCPASAINLLASAGFTNYAWSGPAAYTQTTAINNTSIPGATSLMAGTYTVIGLSALGCSATATASVGLIPVSNATLTPSFVVCQGGNIFLTSTTSVTPTSYNWSGPAGFVSGVQNPTVTTSALLTNSGTYSLSTSYTSGTTTCVYVNTTNVTVSAAAPAALLPIPMICNNGSINLVSPAGGTSYSWSGPNAFSSALQNPTIANASVVNIGTYTVTITTGLCVITGTVNITVFNTLSFSGLPANATLCFNKNGILSASGLGGSGSYNYVWTPTTGLATPNSGTTTVTGATSTSYTVTLSDANCPMTVSPFATANVIVNPTPVITMTTSNNRGCEVFCTDLKSTSIPASANCQWRFTNGLASGACNTSNFCFPTHGTYGATLTVTDINGCVDSLKNNAFILVDPNPNADFGWTPDNPTILINDISFHDQSTIGLPITAWFWDFGDVFVNDSKDFANIPNPTHLYENAYTYSVNLLVINKFGCRDSVMKILKVEDEFSLFIPNSFTPGRADGNNDVFKVAGMGFIAESFEMRIFDRWGELVFKTNDINKGWDGSVKGGKIARTDAYVYKIKVKNFNNKTKEFVGHVTIID